MINRREFGTGLVGIAFTTLLGRLPETTSQQLPSFSTAAPASSVTVQYARGSSVTFPVEVTENGILFRVKVNDSPEPLYFTLDSGAGATYLDTAVAKRLGLTPSGEGSVKGAGAGRVAVQHLTNVRFTLPGLIVTYPEINTIDLSQAERQGWTRPVAGQFGFDFIRKFVVTIDFDNHLLTLSDPEQFVYHGPGEIVPIHFGKKWPYIPGTIKVPGIPATKALFLVDSGSGDGANHQLIKQSKGPLVKTQGGVGLGQTAESVIGQAEYFQVGKFIVRDVPSLPWGQDGETTGQIGTGILRRFKVIFNYSKSQLVFEPGKMYSRR